MSIDLSRVTGISDSRGVITEIRDSLGRVIWAATTATNEPPAIFEVAKQTATTYAGETKYENEEFICFDIYPKKGGTVKVTYGGLTKTIKDTSMVEEPNAIQVFFGTFNGVSDSTPTPASGMLTIDGAYRGFGIGAYANGANKTPSAYAPCVTNVVDFGNPVYIGARLCSGCTNLALTSLPENITYIGDYAFYSCTNLALTSLPENITYIGEYAFYYCAKINISNFPDSLARIGNNAFYMAFSGSDATAMYKGTITLPETIETIGANAFCTNEYNTSRYLTYLARVILKAKTPPTISDSTFGSWLYGGNSNEYLSVVVPAGCREAYIAADIWRYEPQRITEAT